MNYQSLVKKENIPVYLLGTDAGSETLELADSLRAQGHALFRLRCTNGNSPYYNWDWLSSLSCTLDRCLESEFAGSVMKAIFSDKISRTAFLHPWVWKRDCKSWVSADELKHSNNRELLADPEGLSIAMFVTTPGTIAHALILHNVPWKLMSNEYEVFHSRAIGILTDGVACETKTVHQSLSASERNCLVWCACGKTSREISEILSLSEHTVNHYFSLASSKLNVVNRTQAVAKAIKTGLIGLDEIC